MLTTVEGVYRNGQVELAEQPPDVKEARVFVTFVEMRNGNAPPIGDKPTQMLQYGKYAGPDMSTEEDFKIAEWHGKPEFNDDYK